MVSRDIQHVMRILKSPRRRGSWVRCWMPPEMEPGHELIARHKTEHQSCGSTSYVLDDLSFERRPAGPSAYRRADDKVLTIQVADVALSGEYVLIMETVRKLKA